MDKGPDIYTVGRGFLAALAGETNAVTEMVTLAVAIADQSARFDIEFGCTVVMVAGDNGGEWIDTHQPSEEVLAMDRDARQRYGNQLVRAMRYLELRDQIERHPTFHLLIRFSDEPAVH